MMSLNCCWSCAGSYDEFELLLCAGAAQARPGAGSCDEFELLLCAGASEVQAQAQDRMKLNCCWSAAAGRLCDEFELLLELLGSYDELLLAQA